jgi:hypothetical protein
MFSGCDGETDAPFDDATNLLQSFDTSECIGTGFDPVTRLTSVTVYNPEYYRGVECIAWDVDFSGQLNLDLFSKEMNCTGLETAHAVLSDSGNIELRLNLPDKLADCMCCFNLCFTVNGVSTDADIQLDLVTSANEWDDSYRESVTLPLATEPSGIRCRYNAGLHRNCVLSETFLYCGDDEPCPDGKECIEVSSDVPTAVCMEPCDIDNDCPSALLRCQEGFCHLAKTW